MTDYINVGIVGSRGYNSLDEMETVIHQIIDDDYDSSEVCIVSGGAHGADALAEKVAIKNEYHFIEVPALWDVHGRRAGIIRNPVIVNISDIVFAFWDGKSRGTLNTINITKASGTPLIVYDYMTKKVKAFT